jgi:hypothetical protein
MAPFECPICYEDVSLRITRLPCTHEICSECYERLCFSICPMCRAVFYDKKKTSDSECSDLTRIRRAMVALALHEQTRQFV